MTAQLELIPTAPPAAPPAASTARATDPDAGPRQTVERLRHPTLGEVVAVYDHGPAYLRTADGARVDVLRIGDGGASSAREDRPARSWRVVHTAGGGRTEADIIVRGDSHKRTSSPLLGMGWMVWLAEGFRMRWEGDDGRVLPLDVRALHAGDAAYIAESARVEKSRKRDKVWPKLEGEARNWMRLTMRDGTSMDFRREQP